MGTYIVNGDFYFSSSSLTGEFSTSYSDSAIRDMLFDNTKDTPVVKIINLLKSYNWDIQNRGISQINSTDFSGASVDELFVLGRNIYQTGCSNSWSANTYFENLKTNIQFLSREVAFHLLNGLAFEIYFDKSGRLRNKFKTGRLNEVLTLLMDIEFKNSALFIHDQLSPYDYRVIFDPISVSLVTIDILCDKKGDGIYVISSINILGKNVMYNFEGTDYYNVDNGFILKKRNVIKTEICEMIAAKESSLIINFLNVDSEIDSIGMPYEFKLLNYRIK